MLLLRCLILALIVTHAVAEVSAQVERVLPRRGGSSLEGTSFVVGFMANEILEFGEDPRIQVFISSQFDATVTISSPLASPVTYTILASTVRVFSMNAMHVVNASEQVSPKAIFIESDVPIVVYTLNTLALSTDSYTAIPIKQCGTDYYTVNRPTDWYKQGRNFNPLDRAPRVGEFMIMATQDGTDVLVTPRVGTRGGRAAGQPFMVQLKKGDCYLVQAQATRHGGDDLTGSSISSNVPVAVISGHMRSSVPTDSAISKDHLVEQLPPVNKWGRTYATSPFAQIVRPDVFRIVASRPNQTVQLTTRFGSATFTLASPGMWRDTVLKEPASWTSNEPFLLTQFMSSSTSGAYGDPAMVIVPPIEQYVNQSMFQFPVLEESGLDNQQFFYFFNVVAEAAALSTLRVNSTLATTISPDLRTQTIPGTSLHWATMQLREGAFTMQADTGFFSGVMYGTSIVDSYANMVGVAYDSIRPDDVSPPMYRLDVACGEVSGLVRDTSLRTAKLDDVRVISSRTTNYRWSLVPVSDDSASVEIWAQVKDLWRDAQIVFQAYNNQGNGREWLYMYDAPNVQVPSDVVIDATKPGVQCTTAVFRNRDSTPVTIARVSLSGDARFSIPSPISRDTVILPGDSLVITVCMRRTSDTSQARGTIIIEYPCRLQRFVNVRSATVASLTTVPLDFGDVRVGDTACSRLPIINNGPSDVIVTAVLVEKQFPQFRPDLVRLQLPRLLRPRDTLWVPVCFTPDTVGRLVRTDTVRSAPDCGLRTSIAGRGVRPDVASITIDWGQRRVGVFADSSAVLRNVGTGWITLQGWQTWSDTLVETRGPSSAQRLNPNDSVSLAFRMKVSRRGLAERIDTVACDWLPHRTITVRHIVRGVQPDLQGIDTDFGNVVVGMQADSVIDHLMSGNGGGNAPVVIRSIRTIGPDSAAFQVPVELLATTSLKAVDTLRAQTRFTPLRPGLHRCMIEVIYDGANAGADTTITYELRGQGLKPLRANLTLDISTATSVLACQTQPLTITVGNSGDGIGRIDTIELAIGSERRFVVADTQGIDIVPGGQQQWSVEWSSVQGSDPVIVVRVVDSAGQEIRDTLVVTVRVPEASLSMIIDGAPVLETGDSEIRATVRLDQSTDVVHMPRLVVTVPRTRYVSTTNQASIVGVRAGGPIDTVVSVVQQDSVITLELPAGRGPWDYQVRVPGVVLWEDPRPFAIAIALDSTTCYHGAHQERNDLVSTPCGSGARVVRLRGRSGIIATVLSMPVRDELVLRLESEAATALKITVETLTGQSFTLVEGFSLQKGVQHCNFSCSGWASGVYRVHVQGSSGETDCKVIIVN